MENNHGAKLHSDLARWLRATLCGQPPPQERVALEKKIKSFKERQDAMSLAFIFLRKSKDEYVQWFSASIVEVCCAKQVTDSNLHLLNILVNQQGIVNKRWHSLSLEIRERFRKSVYALLLEQAKVPETFLALLAWFMISQFIRFWRSMPAKPRENRQQTLRCSGKHDAGKLYVRNISCTVLLNRNNTRRLTFPQNRLK